MEPYLVGTTILKDGIKYDYCFEECIKAMTEVCDKVIVFVASNSSDGTSKIVYEMAKENNKIWPVFAVKWEGKGEEIYYNFERYFYDNICPVLWFDQGHTNTWRMHIDPDEIIHEASYKKIREVIKDDYYTEYYFRRVNIFKKFKYCKKYGIDKLCGDENIRLAKIPPSKENNFLNPHAEGFNKTITTQRKYIDELLLYHYGYARSGAALVNKVCEFQAQFLGTVDPGVAEMKRQNMYTPYHLKDSELQPIPLPHPEIMKNWIKAHSYDPTRTIQLV